MHVFLKRHSRSALFSSTRFRFRSDPIPPPARSVGAAAGLAQWPPRRPTWPPWTAAPRHPSIPGHRILRPSARELSPLPNRPSGIMDFDDLVEKKKINLSCQNLRDGDLDVLIEVLRKSDVLEELLLNFNRLTLADGRMAEAIAHSRTLRVLVLINNQIADEGAKRLAGAIKVNKTLQVICLYYNEIGVEGAKSVADALAVNKSLRELGLWRNEVGDAGAQSLATSFETNQTLRTISLANNNITDEGAQKLVDALKKNCTINELDLGTDPVGIRVKRKINTILKNKLRIQFQEVIASKNEEVTALKQSLASKEQELENREEKIASLEAEHSASLKEFDSYKKSIQGPLEQLNKAAKTVDLTGRVPGPSNKRPRTTGGS